MKGVGAYPSWQSQLSKFASVQDRLRAWRDDVREKINVMSCIQIAMLDIDGFRMDKALQTTVDAQADFSVYQRDCAKKHGKENFLIVGEAVGEIPFSAIYMGVRKFPEHFIPLIVHFASLDTPFGCLSAPKTFKKGIETRELRGNCLIK